MSVLPNPATPSRHATEYFSLPSMRMNIFLLVPVGRGGQIPV